MGDKEHVQYVLLDPNHDSEKRGNLGKIFEEVQQLADRLDTGGGFCTIPVAAPETRPRLYTLVCFANNKPWDFYFFSNKM